MKYYLFFAVGQLHIIILLYSLNIRKALRNASMHSVVILVETHLMCEGVRLRIVVQSQSWTCDCSPMSSGSVRICVY